MAVETVKEWVARYTNELPFEKATAHLREQAAELVAAYLPGANEYAVEKLVKSFAEPIYYLADFYIRQEAEQIGADYRRSGLTSHQLAAWREVLPRIEERLLGEINRQFRHFSVFLGAARQQAHH